MKSRSLTMLLVLFLTTVASPFTLAQTGNPAQQTTGEVGTWDWQGLRDLKPNKRIRIEFRNGSAVDGKLVSLFGGTLTLDANGDSYKLEQSAIQRVYRLKGGWSRSITTRIGAAIGMVAGVVIGTNKMLQLESDPTRIHSDADEIPVVAGMALGTLAGAGIGALLGGSRRGKLLYEAK